MMPWMTWADANPLAFWMLFLTALLFFMALLTALIERGWPR